MKASNQLQQNTTAQTKVGFSNIITMPKFRDMIDKCVGDPQRAAQLISTLISVVNTTPKLQNCKAETIISAALRGEIGMGLSVALGDYAIIPYGEIATFQLQVDGLKRLGIRSGQYKKVRLREVKQGEFVGFDPASGDPMMKWEVDPEKRDALPIIGYYGYYELMNGFSQCIYWTHERILKHADRYSKAFSFAKYRDLCDGKLSASDAKYLQGGSPWYALPDETPHQKMCKKTIAKQLLGDGLAPKEVSQAIIADNEEEQSGEPNTYANDLFPQLPTFPIPVDENTGEVLTPEPEPEKDAAPETAKRSKRTASNATVDNAQPQEADATGSSTMQGSFFDDGM